MGTKCLWGEDVLMTRGCVRIASKGCNGCSVDRVCVLSCTGTTLSRIFHRNEYREGVLIGYVCYVML